jgi:hypothetical protein
MYVNSIYDIPLQKMKKIGIEGIIIDLDNTITEWNNPYISDNAKEWFQMFKENNFKICLASNNNQKRVVKIASSLGIPYIAKAGKPRRRAFKQAMKILGTNNKNTAVIGDQVFTDILGGNRLNLFTILVVPLSTKEFFGTKIMRFVERKILKFVVPKS